MCAFKSTKKLSFKATKTGKDFESSCHNKFALPLHTILFISAYHYFHKIMRLVYFVLADI